MRTVGKFLAVSLCILGIPGLAMAKSSPSPMTQAISRIAQARVYQQRQWTLLVQDQSQPSETPTTVGQALASLTPTWVAGLIRVSAGQPLTQDQIDAFNTIRSLVLAVNPDCKFDIVLNAAQYTGPNDIVNQMKAINAQVPVDIWYLEKFYETYRDQRTMIDAAITYAHSQGQPIGGDALLNQMPPHADFAVVETQNFSLDARQIDRLIKKYHIPVIAHLDDETNATEARTFITKYDTAQRIGYITRLAKNQKSWKYRLMYPIFYPLYPAGEAYDSLQDDSILGLILSLMQDYN